MLNNVSESIFDPTKEYGSYVLMTEWDFITVEDQREKFLRKIKCFIPVEHRKKVAWIHGFTEPDDIKITEQNYIDMGRLKKEIGEMVHVPKKMSFGWAYSGRGI